MKNRRGILLATLLLLLLPISLSVLASYRNFRLEDLSTILEQEARPGKPRVALSASPYDEVLKRAYAESVDLDRLQLRTGRIDPRVETLAPAVDFPFDLERLPAPARELRARLTTRDYRLVQFESRPDAEARNALLRAGLKPVAYIPNNAYIVAAPSEDSDARFQRVEGARAVAPLPPALKTDPRLLALARPGFAPESALMIDLSAFPGETMEGWDLLAEILGARVIMHDREGGPRLRLNLPVERLPDLLTAFATLPGVDYLGLYRLPVLLNFASIWLLQSDDTEFESTPIFNAGITGFGQVYASADSGIDTDACHFRYSDAADAQTFFREVNPPDIDITNPGGKLIAYYVISPGTAYDDKSGHYHGTMTTGCAVGDNYAHLATEDDPGIDRADGMAPGAKIVFQDVANEKGELWGLAFFSAYQLNKQAYLSGARVHNDSYGSEENINSYEGSSRSLDKFLWEYQDYSIFFAAGNSGPRERTLGGEGSTAKNTVVSGASMAGWYGKGDMKGEDLVSFSSRGPCEDGRLKPDLVAPGIVYSATETKAIPVPGVTDVYGNPAATSTTDPGNNQCDTDMTAGTSFSSPTAAGMALLIRQYFTDGFYPSGLKTPTDAFTPTGALIKALLINSSRALRGYVLSFGGGSPSQDDLVDPIPSTMQGYGRITLDDALYLYGDRRDLNVLADILNGSEEALVDGEEREWTVYVKEGDSFKVTLVWTDPEGSAHSSKALVNDLDLQVISPTRETYRGNVAFQNSFSTPAGSEPADSLNNIEQVVIGDPREGTWTIRVSGTSVPGNGNDDPYDSAVQGFALVATGNLGEGEDLLLPRLSLKEAKLSGGCDEDDSLDANEVADLTVKLLNLGDADSGPLTMKLEVESEGTDVPSSMILLPNDGMSQSGNIPQRSTGSVQGKVGLGNITEDICLKNVTLIARFTTANGDPVGKIRIPLQTGFDRLQDSSQSCQETPCSPPPVITAVTPDEILPGVSIFKMSVEGEHLFSDGSLRFSSETLAYDSIEFVSPMLLELRNVRVPLDHPAGEVTLYFTSSGGVEVAFPGLLSVVEPAAEDGDAEGAREETDGAEEDSEPPPAAHGGGGCRSADPGPALIWLVLAALAGVTRRRRTV